MHLFICRENTICSLPMCVSRTVNKFMDDMKKKTLFFLFFHKTEIYHIWFDDWHFVNDMMSWANRGHYNKVNLSLRFIITLLCPPLLEQWNVRALKLSELWILSPKRRWNSSFSRNILIRLRWSLDEIQLNVVRRLTFSRPMKCLLIDNIGRALLTI